MKRVPYDDINLYVSVKLTPSGALTLACSLGRGDRLTEEQSLRLPHMSNLIKEVLSRMEQPDISTLPDVSFGYTLPVGPLTEEPDIAALHNASLDVHKGLS